MQKLKSAYSWNRASNEIKSIPLGIPKVHATLDEFKGGKLLPDALDSMEDLAGLPCGGFLFSAHILGKQGRIHPNTLRQEGGIQHPVILKELLQVQVEP